MAPPPAARGRNALTALGGGVLVLAVAGGAWALFGRDDKKGVTSAGRSTTSTAAPKVLGPVVPGSHTKVPTKVPAKTAGTSKPTSTVIGPVAATSAATAAPKPAPVKAAVATKAPAPAVKPAVKPAVTPTVKPVAKPPVAGSQQGGTVATKRYTLRVARGDTLWGLTKKTLAATGHSTLNADVAAAVQKLYSNNKAVIGSNPDLILPGQTIVWPTGS